MAGRDWIGSGDMGMECNCGMARSGLVGRKVYRLVGEGVYIKDSNIGTMTCAILSWIGISRKNKPDYVN